MTESFVPRETDALPPSSAPPASELDRGSLARIALHHDEALPLDVHVPVGADTLPPLADEAVQATDDHRL